MLIDFQRAFLDGAWAKQHGVASGEMRPIIAAAERAASVLLGQPTSFGAMPIMTTRCYLDGPDSELPPFLVECLPTDVPFVHKPTMDVMKSADFTGWMERQMDEPEGVEVLVVGGCTTTSCVRVSSQAIQRHFSPKGLQVVVDLSLCGARVTNYCAQNAQQDIGLRQLFGSEMVKGRSAVELAILQMERAGVQVVTDFFAGHQSH